MRKNVTEENKRKAHDIFHSHIQQLNTMPEQSYNPNQGTLGKLSQLWQKIKKPYLTYKNKQKKLFLTMNQDHIIDRIGLSLGNNMVRLCAPRGDRNTAAIMENARVIRNVYQERYGTLFSLLDEKQNSTTNVGHRIKYSLFMDEAYKRLKKEHVIDKMAWEALNNTPIIPQKDYEAVISSNKGYRDI